jgi:hypothetical protein
MKKLKNIFSPHCPGDIQLYSENNKLITIAILAGLKQCLLLILNKNFEDIAKAAIKIATKANSVLTKIDNENAVIRQLLISIGNLNN